MFAVVTLDEGRVHGIESDVNQLRENFDQIDVFEARRRLQELGGQIEGVRGQVRTLREPLLRKMESSYATLLELKNRLERKEMRRLLTGAEVLVASGNQYHDERGTAACGPIVGKALEKMLQGGLNSREVMDGVIQGGTKAYEELIATLSQRSSYFQIGTHLGWKEEVEPKFDETLEEVGEVIKRELIPDTKRIYLNILEELESRRGGSRIGGMLLVGREYFGVCLGRDEVCIFDSHGSHAITRGNSPAFMVKARNLDHAAELLAFRREHLGVKELDEVSCYPVQGKQIGSSEALVLVNPVEVEAVIPTQIQLEFRPVVTSQNRDAVVRMVQALEKVIPSDTKAVQEILSEYKTVELSRDLGSGIEVRATILVLRAELYFYDANLLKPQEAEVTQKLRAPIIEESDGEEDVFYDCIDYLEEEIPGRVGIKEKQHLVQKVAEVGTLFIRDHLLPATLKEEALDRDLIVERVEEWFKKFLPKLFFDRGTATSQQKADLGLTCEVIGSMTRFIKDYNGMRSVIEKKEGRCVPRKMHTKVYHEMQKGQASEQEILFDFCQNLLNLYEAQQSKPLGEDKKGQMALSSAKVLDALIDTVLSPEFSKLLVLGFLNDDEIVREVQELQTNKTSEIEAEEVPVELQMELTKFVNELIDFGNPSYSSWIATSMLKTHFMRTDSPGMMKSTLRFGMRILSKPFFKDEIGAFLKEAFSIQKTGGAPNEEWVKIAALGIRVIRWYGWTETGVCKLGSVQERANIPEALFQKISRIVHEVSSRKTSWMFSTTSWVMPSVHTFGRSLTENLYALSQSRKLMRTYTIRYLVGGVLTREVQRQRALISPRTSILSAPVQEGVPEQLGQRMSHLVGDYLRGYVKELYLKETPLVTNVVDLSVTMVQGFLPEVVACSARENKALSKAKQQMIVDFYGAFGTFLKDYALAIQEAKKNPTYPVLAEQGKEERLIITALERVREAPIKISDRDVNKKLEAISDLLIRSQCHGVTPMQAQFVRSTAFVLPEVLKGGIDLFFSPDMMNVLLLNCLESFEIEMPVDDPEYQYQSWDAEVLSRWNDTLFALVNGIVEIGEPQGKMKEIAEALLGVGEGARQNLGSLLTRFSYGPSPLFSPAVTLQTISILEKALFTREKKAKITNVFCDSQRGKREEALRGALKGVLTRHLPMDSIHSVTSGWVGETVQKVMKFGQSAANHLGSLSSLLSSEQIRGTDGPLLRAFKHEVEQRTSGALNFLLPSSERSLSSGLQGFLYERLSEVMSGSDIVQSLSSENPIIRYFENACGNVMNFFKSKALMRTFVYNYVLTPKFFNHLVQNLDKERGFLQSSLAGNLPGSLFLDMTAFSWVLPGPMRNPALLDTPRMEQGFQWNPPEPSIDFSRCFESMSRQLLESERLFEASKASPTLNALFAKLSCWEKEGKVAPELIRKLVNQLENPKNFYEGVKQLLSDLEQKLVLSRDERVALKGEAKKGEFPFVFRYLDLMMSDKTPVMIALFGQNSHESLRQAFLERAVSEVNGSVIQKMEPLHLAKSFEKWIIPYMKGSAVVRSQMQAVLEILANDKKRDSIAEKFIYLFGETKKYVPLRETDALFFKEVLDGFETEDPLSNAMQLFSIHETVEHWENKVEKIHQVLGHLRLESRTDFPLMEKIEPQLKGYYQKLGMILSEVLVSPFSDKLKLAYTEQFLSRYRSLAGGVAPSNGERASHSCSVAMTPHAQKGNEHKLQLLGAAKKSIVMSGCYFGGKIFGRALAVIEGNLRENPELDVKLIGSDYMLTSENKMQIRALEEIYPNRFLMQITPEVQLYNSPISDRTSYRTNHSKLLVIDYGKYFEMGGSGLADRWTTPGTKGMISPSGRSMEPLGFRDVDFIFKSEEDHGIGYALYLELTSLFPIWGAKDVKDRIQASFDPRFHHVARPHCTSARAPNVDDHEGRKMSDDVTFYSTGPDSTTNNFTKDLIQDIDDAQEVIHIQHMYFHPTQELLDSLERAAERGVAIEICTNRTGPDMPFTHEFFVELSRSNWKSLYKGKSSPKIKIFEFNVANTTYHKKIVMIDRRTVYLGSTNLGEKSLKMNDHEINLRVSSRDLGHSVYEEIQREIGPCFESVGESSDSACTHRGKYPLEEGLQQFAQSSDRNAQALANASLQQVQTLAEKGCSLISIKSWAYAAIVGQFTADSAHSIGFQNISHPDRERFKAVMGINEVQGKISSYSFTFKEIITIAKSFSDRTILLRNPSDVKFMEIFYSNLLAGQDPRTSSTNAYSAVSCSLLSESMQVFAEGLSNTLLPEREQQREIGESLFREVPGNEAPHMAIDRAALAQVQSSILKRWL